MEVKTFTKILKPKQRFWPSSEPQSDYDLEAKINLWFASQPDIEIKNIKQLQSGGSLLPEKIVATVWYVQCIILFHTS
ncbi:hypothetical protein [Thalassotalea piscium]|uniref:Uncharacterized protein n=1 Tax=Thalassotalea piscium TaxID=1230533 RepID=A0A7X0NI99_9GAMM|nr:hypothetical protein [Thalassotalea piscium]MBB6543982.1 hypothetical protein [Thalassotalea piscium]